MKKIIIIVFSLMAWTAHAKDYVEVYGDSDTKIKPYFKQINDVMQKVKKLYIADSPEKRVETEKEQLRLRAIKKQLEAKIKKEGNYAAVLIENITYPGSLGSYTTIDVVRKDDIAGIDFIKKTKPRDTTKKPVVKQDIINQRMAFNDLETRLIITNQLKSKSFSCPVYHCLTDFDDKRLKPYLEIFNNAARDQKKLITDTLMNDTAPERRIAAVSLVGHYTDPQEIVNVLQPKIYDEDSGVRNMAIRVMSTTIHKAPNVKLDPEPFLKLLHSPYVLDRNKSLIVLLTLSEKNKYKPLIRESGETLVKLLALKQPDNHELAYQVLKNISGKKYDAHDLTAWRNWLMQQKKLVA